LVLEKSDWEQQGGAWSEDSDTQSGYLKAGPLYSVKRGKKTSELAIGQWKSARFCATRPTDCTD